MARQKNTAARIQAEERRRVAVELRKAGASFEEIARSLGIKKQSAHALVVKALEEIRARTTEQVEHLRVLETARLDTLLKGLWPSASKGNPQAVEKAIKIMERRARMLGIDAPTKVAPTDPGGENPYQPKMSDEELDERIRQLAAKVGMPGGDVADGGA